MTKIQKQRKEGRFISVHSFRGCPSLRKGKHGRSAELEWQDHMLGAVPIPGYQEAESMTQSGAGETFKGLCLDPKLLPDPNFHGLSEYIAPRAAEKC